eukprot:200676-Chlamydomonas_euryale.AAC.8
MSLRLRQLCSRRRLSTPCRRCAAHRSQHELQPYDAARRWRAVDETGGICAQSMAQAAQAWVHARPAASVDTSVPQLTPALLLQTAWGALV